MSATRDTCHLTYLPNEWLLARQPGRLKRDTSLKKVRALVCRSVEKERTNEAIDLRGILEAPLLPFSPGSDEKERKATAEDSWHTQEDPERTFWGAFRLIILIYCRERNPTWLYPRRAYPVVNNATSSSWENFLTLSPLFSSSFARSLSSSGPSLPASRASEPVPPPSTSMWCKPGREKGLTSGNTEGGRPWQGPTTTMSGSLPPNALAIDEYARS